MIEGRPSRTAEGQAINRAIEALVSKDRQVCYDALAMEFLDEAFRQRYGRIQRSRLRTMLSVWLLHRDPAGMKAESAARTRCIDDYVRACIANGFRQVVILGAGYDSRAYRIKALEQIKVFELDHPDTQERKTAAIRRVFGKLPAWVSYVAIDFEKQDMRERLLASGYSRDLKTLFIWEGVTCYLTAEAVDRTLQFVVGNSSGGSSIIFNYWYRSAVESESKWKWAKTMRKRSEQVGEPITFGVEEEDIEAFLIARGFSQVKRFTPSDLNRLYFQGPNAWRKTCAFIEIVHASVGSSG